ncbi:hypothetical protein BGZ76_005094 [Entomortierella beljakovae]|nr:hypothetical protein BGZ76_005094 [Entomortierella beljakovae]
MNDPAFPVQIQEELLNQVRYWTSQAEMKEKLNQEYDTKITEMERIIDALNKQRRMREESDERMKEDQWNLEIMNQDLRGQNTDLQQQLSRAVHDNSKIQKALTVASEQLEQIKDKEERTAGQLELTKTRHEQDMNNMRKHTAGIQRDKSDLIKKMEDLQTTMAQQQQKLSKKAMLEALALVQENEEPESPIEAPILIQAPPRLPSNDEIAVTAAAVTPAPAEPKATSLARETSFAHQQSIINDLQAKLNLEIAAKEQLLASKEEWATTKEELLTEKDELVKLLADREETIEALRIEGTMIGYENTAIQNPAPQRSIEVESTTQLLEANDGISSGLPVLRPISPIHAGGLFAELIQASSTPEPIKPEVEYRDQEAMTEPIESWIHTIPGLLPIYTPTLEGSSTLESESSAPTKTVVITSTIGTNTEIKSTVDGATSTEVKSLVDGSTSTEVKSMVDGVTSMEAKTVVDGATSTETKSMVDGTTSTEAKSVVQSSTSTSTADLPVSAAMLPQPTVAKSMVDGETATVNHAAPVTSKIMVDDTTSTIDLPAPSVSSSDTVPPKIMVDGTTSTIDLPVPSVSLSDTVPPKVMVDGTTSTIDLPAPPVSLPEPVPSKVMVDGTTSTIDLPAPSVSLPEPVPSKVMVDGTTSTADLPVSVIPTPELEPVKVMVDGTTSTEDLPLLAVQAVEKDETPAKILVDSTTSTDGLPASAMAVKEAKKSLANNTASIVDLQEPSTTAQFKSRATGNLQHRNGQLPDIITGRTKIDPRVLSLDFINNVTTPTVTGLEVAHAHIPEYSTLAHEQTETKLTEPMLIDTSRHVHSHKLEDYQFVPRSVQSDVSIDDERRHTCDMSQSIDVSPQYIPPVPALPSSLQQSQNEVDLSGLDKKRDFNISFGSAFGGDPNKDVILTGRIEPAYSSEQYDSSYYREQSRESHVSVASPGRPSTGPPSNLLARAAARASMASLLESPLAGEIPSNVYSNNTNSPTTIMMSGSHARSPPTSYPQRTASIRSTSIRTEKPMTSSSPPHQQARNPISTGAAFISGTTRTAYTFSNSTSQVHIPQQPVYQHITDSSGASIGRSKYRPSPSDSVSSLSTDYDGNLDRRLSIGSNYDGAPAATDPTMIQIITQTMIGDYLWKYTRRPMANVISEKRHRRYFWVHPYTKTVYWSLNNPAADGSREQRAKSALIMNVYQITDDNASGNSDLPNVSLLVQTSNRNLKVTAPTREKHELWYQSLSYLLSRPTTPGADVATDNQTWSEIQAARGSTSNALLTIKNEKSVRKKGSFNRLQTMFGRSKENSPSSSPRSAGPLSQGAGNISGVSTTSLTYIGGPATGNNVVAYTSQTTNTNSGVGGYGTMNGGPIISQASYLGTNTSPKSRLTEVHGYDHEYYDEGDEGEEDDDEDDGELPEHVRQCCGGKHDIGSLHHVH